MITMPLFRLVAVNRFREVVMRVVILGSGIDGLLEATMPVSRVVRIVRGSIGLADAIGAFITNWKKVLTAFPGIVDTTRLFSEFDAYVVIDNDGRMIHAGLVYNSDYVYHEGF